MVSRRPHNMGLTDEQREEIIDYLAWCDPDDSLNDTLADVPGECVACPKDDDLKAMLVHAKVAELVSEWRNAAREFVGVS